MLQATEVLSPVYSSVWPERRLERVTVVCEGPSALRASPADLHAAALDGPIVAVNRAIAFSDVLPIDVWATTDDPRNLWEWAQPHLHDETKLLSVEDKVIVWQKLLPDFSRLYAWHPSSMDAEGLQDEHGLHPLVPSLFPVLAWLLHVGARDVRLLGVDMVGSGTPFLDDYSDDADEGYQIRWAVEREMLAHTARHYRARGARITRWDRSKRSPS